MENFEKVLLVGVYTADQSYEDFTYELDELENLCEACQMTAVDRIVQNLDYVNNVSYVGKGKLSEIRYYLDNNEVDGVVFNDELTPAQVSNIQDALDVQIYDRTYIILEIFSRRAKTKEAKLQVDIARLRYMLPRLAGLHKGMSRQRGAGGGFAHGRGAGETKLELERRATTDRIVSLKKELADFTKLRKQQRVLRKKNDVKTVSLVGYTNSGKSTTLNTLLAHSKGIKKEVFQKDMLFATLETSTRMIETTNSKFLLTDTVGFVSKLPHLLVEAFKSTLEEIKESDLIVHVVDCSNPNFFKQITVTNEVLKEIGVVDIPIIYAFNKIDKVVGYFYIPQEYEKVIKISAKNSQGIDELLKAIEEVIFSDYVYLELVIPYEKQPIIYTELVNGIDTSVYYEQDYILWEGKLPQHIANKIDPNLKK